MSPVHRHEHTGLQKEERLKQGETLNSLNHGWFLKEVTEWRRLAALRVGQTTAAEDQSLGEPPGAGRPQRTTPTSVSASSAPSSRHANPGSPRVGDLSQGGQEEQCATRKGETQLTTPTSASTSSTSPTCPGTSWSSPMGGPCQGSLIRNWMNRVKMKMTTAKIPRGSQISEGDPLSASFCPLKSGNRTLRTTTWGRQGTVP